MRRTLSLLAVAAALWALVVHLTGGVLLRVGGVRLSSRSALNPALAALVSGALTWVLATSGSRSREVAGDICGQVVGRMARPFVILPTGDR